MHRFRQRSLFFLSAWFFFVSAAALRGQTIDVSLDLLYSDPSDTNSDGTWRLVALASDRGIAGLDIRLVDINLDPTFRAPTGFGADLTTVGFQPTSGDGPFFFDRGDHLEVLFGQIPRIAPGPQGLFYDVGVPGGATQPGENETPTIAGFVAGSNVPWNFTDRLGDLLDDGQSNGSGPFEGGVWLASGTFGTGSQPGFFPGSAGNVFMDVGTATDPPNAIVEAVVATQLRDNSGMSILLGDMDGDGDVDFDDIDPFVLGLTDPTDYEATYAVLPEVRGDTDADGDLDFDDIPGFVAMLADSPLNAGAHTVPEPASGALFAMGAAVMVVMRNRRRKVVGLARSVSHHRC